MIDEAWFHFFLGFIVGCIFMIGVGYAMYTKKVEDEEKASQAAALPHREAQERL